jgi:DNA adenine methylase
MPADRNGGDIQPWQEIGGYSYLNSFMAWVGGKMKLRDIIIERFPATFKTYAEPFCGAAWVFFRKARSKVEALNDMNNNLANLYWQIQENAEALRERLRYAIDCEANFYRIRDALKRGDPLDDLTRAAWFYQLLRFSYGSKASSYNGRGHDMWRDFPALTGAHHRLRGVGVHNKEFEHFIRLMDAEDTFFYCDPPYFGTEDYYDSVVFGRDDHIRLRDLLLSIKGKFLLSYNDCPEIRELYEGHGLFIEEVSRLDNLRQFAVAGSVYPELLISNYDTKIHGNRPQQMGLF